MISRSCIWFAILEIKGELLRLPCKSYANFSIIKHDNALQGSVITTLLFLTDNQCKSMCIMERKCKSFNREIGGDMRCELNDKTTEDWKDNVTAVARPGWTFKSTDYHFHLVRFRSLCHHFFGLCEFRTVNYSGSCAEQVAFLAQSILISALLLIGLYHEHGIIRKNFVRII